MTLQYNHSGELWLVTEQKWTQEEEDLELCDPIRVTRMTEFRGSGRQRYLRRQRLASEDWDLGKLGYVELGSSIWSDYDGDTIYGDYEVVFTEDPPLSGNWSKQVVEKTAYLPGLAQYDHESGDAVYFVTDIVGTTQSITHGGGASARYGQRVIQTAFGERVHADGVVGTRYQYAGAFGYETFPAWGWDRVWEENRYLDDEEMPFVHVGARYYCPETGRFLQSDPIGIEGGMNTYVYCGNNPTPAVDPLGLSVFDNEQFARILLGITGDWSPFTGLVRWRDNLGHRLAARPGSRGLFAGPALLAGAGRIPKSTVMPGQTPSTCLWRSRIIRWGEGTWLGPIRGTVGAGVAWVGKHVFAPAAVVITVGPLIEEGVCAGYDIPPGVY